MTKPTGRPRGRPKEKEYVTLMARVPLELAERARRYAALHQQNISVMLRDSLELLLEEDRYRPFVSDTNREGAFLSDRNGDAARPAEPMPDIVSDTNRDEPTPALEMPVSPFMSDTKEGGDSQAPPQALPAFQSDMNAVDGDHAPAPQEPAILSDTNADYDTTRYMLGPLCKRGHAWSDSGLSLRSRKNRECLACGRDRAGDSRERKRARVTAGEA